MTISSNASVHLRWSFWPQELKDKDQTTGTPKRGDYLFFALIFLFAASLNTIFIHNQLWQDELFTLQKFVLVPFKTTLTDYHVTNNHIFFNLLMSVYLKLIGADFNTLLLHPEIVRIIPYSFTLLSIIVFYFLSQKIFGSSYANIALVLYCTSLQVYTFGTQCRGYSLEVLLCTGYLLMIFRFVQTRAVILLYGIAGIGALMLINLPSTIYYCSGIFLVVFGYFLAKQRKSGISSECLQLAVAIAVSFVLFALYFSIIVGLNQVLDNNQLYSGQNRYITLIKQPFGVVYRFFDWRVYLIIPVVLLIFLKLRGSKSNRVSIFLVVTFFTPFILFAVHNPEMVLRIWIVLLPHFCITIAGLCLLVVRNLDKHLWKFALLNIIALVCSLFFLKKQIRKNNSTNFITLDLRYQYHLYGYNPLTALASARKEAANSGAELTVCEGFSAGIDYYLKALKIDTVNDVPIKGKKFVLVTDDTTCINKYRRMNFKVINQDAHNSDQFYKWYTFE